MKLFNIAHFHRSQIRAARLLSWARLSLRVEQSFTSVLVCSWFANFVREEFSKLKIACSARRASARAAAFVHTLGSSRRAGFIRHGVGRLARRCIWCAWLPSDFSSRMRNIEQIFFLSTAQYSDGAAHEGRTHARISTHHPNQVFNRTPFLSDMRQRREGYTHHA
jgi:hypothetical protein